MAGETSNPWAIAQGRLQAELDEHSYKNWFSQTRFQSFHDGALTVQVPSQFFANWLRDHYLDTISDSLRSADVQFESIQFVPNADLLDERAWTDGAGPEPKSTAPRRRGAVSPRFGFNKKYSFDRFVIGAGNRFAHAAAKAVVEAPARAYNPLFLYGQTGLGKTHLMHAIGQEILERDPSKTAVFISSEQFTNELIESIANKSAQRFRAKYRKVDVLLIDDIHFIAGKEATQEEFFHTFNELFDRHKQIVLSSDRGPKEIKRLEERLVSRFEWGLVTDIQPPDVETRMAILKNKANEDNVDLDPEVLRYIASCVSTNVRELEGALVTVLAYSRLIGQEVSLPLVEKVVHDLIGSAKVKPITADTIQKAVAEHFDVRLSDMKGKSRQRQIAYPRQISMYLCKELIPNMTLNEIGQAFGGKDHTTVMYACQKLNEELQRDEVIRKTIAQLERSIREA